MKGAVNLKDHATSPVDVLFFARGRGRGHAVPDTAIVDELLQLSPDLNVCFASYATGAIIRLPWASTF
jgi:hypothetical protein